MSMINSSQPQPLPTSLTGEASPSPLQFAFAKKTGAHAHRGERASLSGQAALSTLNQQLQQSQASHRPRAIYIHIPFCRVRCSFCNFFQYASKPQMMDEYFQCLEKELLAKAAYPWTQAKAFDAVYVPIDTQFLTCAKQAGLDILSGFDLFLYQAVDSCIYFTDQSVDFDEVTAGFVEHEKIHSDLVSF